MVALRGHRARYGAGVVTIDTTLPLVTDEAEPQAVRFNGSNCIGNMLATEHPDGEIYWHWTTGSAHGDPFPIRNVRDGEPLWGGGSYTSTGGLADRSGDHPDPAAGQDGSPVAFTSEHVAALEAEIARLREEKDFLLARSGRAGSVSFGGARWTGMSSNALVTVAFGGSDSTTPSDNDDLAACYRCVMRMPLHLRTKAVFIQLERGEREVASRYDIGDAAESAKWPGRAALKGPAS